MHFRRIETLINFTKGKKPLNTSKKLNDGYLPYVDIKAFETGVIDNYTDGEKCVSCQDGDLLIVCDGSRSGLVGKAVDGYVGSTLAKIDVNDEIDICYLYYFIQGKYQILNTNVKGTGTPHLKQDLLKSFEIYLPSLAEQQRIVTKIEELFSKLDKGVEELNKIKEQLKIYRQAVLKEAFDDISANKTIQELSEIVTSGSRGWAKYYADKGARFVRITDMTREGIELKNDAIQFVNLPENAEGCRSKLQGNDVLVSITADLGCVALVPTNIGEAYINQHIAMIRFLNSNQGRFMSLYLKSEHGQKDLLKNKRGAGKLGLGLEDIRNTKVPGIDDLSAKRIVGEIDEKLSVCDKIEQTVNESLQKAESLRQSILKQAFEGKLV